MSSPASSETSSILALRRIADFPKLTVGTDRRRFTNVCPFRDSTVRYQRRTGLLAVTCGSATFAAQVGIYEIETIGNDPISIEGHDGRWPVSTIKLAES